MKFTVNRDIILKAIGIADSVISSKNINTIPSNCLFKISSDSIHSVRSRLAGADSNGSSRFVETAGEPTAVVLCIGRFVDGLD